MRFREFSSSIKPFIISVRLNHQKSVVTTIFYSDSASNLRMMLTELFGKSNILRVSEIVSESPLSDQFQFRSVVETETKTRVLSPQELQVKALADKAEDYKQQEKALKARQQMAKAQQNLMKASSGFSASKNR